ncbi:MAG TPA: CPBP family intramembrane glutamic endopeptidase [Kineosporiaceae bacterium]
MTLTGLLLAGCSGMPLASAVHARWLKGRGVRIVPTHVLTLGVVVVTGTALLGPGWIGNLVADPTGGSGPASWTGWVPWAAAGAAGVVVFAVAAPLDLAICRAYQARHRPTVATAARRPVEGAARLRPVGLAAGRPAAALNNRVASNRRWSPTAHDRELHVGLAWLLASAAAEECSFRGFVLHQVAAFPGWDRAVAIAAVTMAFALSHLFFGWIQVLAKLPLSVLATAAALATGSVLAPLVGHVLFNLQAWQRRPRTAAAPTPRP